MNKSELKTLWGKYVDTDKMVDDIMELLTYYDHRNSEHGVCIMLNAFFTRKESLIKKFISSPHYVGNLRIGLRREFARGNNADEVRRFCNNFENNIGAKDIIYSRTDEHGKKMTDYILTGMKRIEAKKLFDAVLVQQLMSARASLQDFDDEGYTKKSRLMANAFHNIIVGDFTRFSSPTLSKSDVERVLSRDSNLKLAEKLMRSWAFVSKNREKFIISIRRASRSRRANLPSLRLRAELR